MIASASQRRLPARLWHLALDLVFPPRCVGCENFGAFMCETCVSDMTRAMPPRCAVCWMPSTARVCGRCRRSRPSFVAARSAFVYESTARKVVLALKFRGVSALATPMAQQMTPCLLAWSPPVDVIVSVPLGGKRQRLRGYNQAELLAREVARATGLPLETKAVVRRRTTAPQVGQTDEKARYRNVARAFALGSKPELGGVLLVDDVLTTGATLDACASVLLDGGARSVYALTFAKD